MSTPPSDGPSTSPPPTSPSSPSSPASPPPRSSGRRLGAVAGVVLVVAVVVGLLVAGVLPGLHSSGSGGSTSGTGSEGSAAGSANTYANGIPGGPWSLVEVAGIDSTRGESVSVSNLTNSSCPLVGGTLSTLTIPAYSGAYSTGSAEGWLFAFRSTAGSTLYVWVQGGVTSGLGEVGGAGCTRSSSELPGDTISSSMAASDLVATTNGTKFVDRFSSANASYLLDTEQLPDAAPAAVWLVLFDACSSGNETSLLGEVNATTGTLLTSGIATQVGATACGGVAKTPLGSVFLVGVSVTNPLVVGANSSTYAGDGCAARDYCYVLVVEDASPGVTAADLQMEVKTITGASYTTSGPGGFTFYDTETASLVTQTSPTTSGGVLESSEWGSGSSVQLSSVMELLVDTGSTTSPAGTGLVLTVVGLGPYAGSVSVDLP